MLRSLLGELAMVQQGGARLFYTRGEEKGEDKKTFIHRKKLMGGKKQFPRSKKNNFCSSIVRSMRDERRARRAKQANNATSSFLFEASTISLTLPGSLTSTFR
jgi:hypothetical protein